MPNELFILHGTNPVRGKYEVTRFHDIKSAYEALDEMEADKTSQAQTYSIEHLYAKCNVCGGIAIPDENCPYFEDEDYPSQKHMPSDEFVSTVKADQDQLTP